MHWLPYSLFIESLTARSTAMAKLQLGSGGKLPMFVVGGSALNECGTVMRNRSAARPMVQKEVPG
jgi:hypothetical protein